MDAMATDFADMNARNGKEAGVIFYTHLSGEF
jgi:hypothetical protein